MAKAKKETVVEAAGITEAPEIPAALLPSIQAGKTAYLSPDGLWFFSEDTAKKHFETYKIITPKDITQNGNT